MLANLYSSGLKLTAFLDEFLTEAQSYLYHHLHIMLTQQCQNVIQLDINNISR